MKHWTTIQLCLLTLACYSQSQAQTFNIEVQLRTGSKILVQTSQNGIVWNSTQRDNARLGELNWSDFTYLNLIESPIGKRVAQTRDLLDQLADRSYTTREAAEQQLSNPNNSGPFVQMIRNRLDQKIDLESKYRIQRILKSLGESQTESSRRFDEIIKPDGSNEIGEAKDFLLQGVAMGKNVSLKRAGVHSIRTVPSNVPAPATKPLSVQTFNSIENEFYADKSDSLISFESSERGAPRNLGAINNEHFADRGILLATESAGYIQLIKYDFKHCPIDSGKRCLCTFSERLNKRLRGAAIITFCEPGLPNIVAGVRKFGVFLERIEHSRDFVVEAYNSQNQMIGMVEATDQICVFAGFKSNDLITKIRITKNENLPELERNIDETFAFDCITFDQPVAVENLTRSSNGKAGRARIQFESGNVLAVENAEPASEFVAVTNPMTGEIDQIPWKELRSIAFSQFAPPTKFDGNLMVQLKNGSIVRTESSSISDAYDFVGQQIQLDQIVGLWKGTARLPEQNQFESEKPIAVYPSCSIELDGFKLADDGYSWDKNTSKKITQNVHLTDEDNDVFGKAEAPDPDFTPTVDQVSFKDAPGVFPSLWLSQPTTNATGKGYIQLTDGQYFVFNNESGFSLKQIDGNRKSITIALNGTTKTYPLARVVSLSLPKDAADK